jgi:hypothetical protein
MRAWRRGRRRPPPAAHLRQRRPAPPPAPQNLDMETTFAAVADKPQHESGGQQQGTDDTEEGTPAAAGGVVEVVQQQQQQRQQYDGGHEQHHGGHENVESVPALFRAPQILLRWRSDRSAAQLLKPHRSHGWTELFYDLIFVAAAIKLSVLVKHGDLGLKTLGLVVLLWISMYTSWVHFTLFHTRFEIVDEAHNFLVWIHMTSVAIMASIFEGTKDEVVDKLAGFVSAIICPFGSTVIVVDVAAAY